jgi:hypothetical protein
VLRLNDGLKIEFSVKLSNRAVVDFDIDTSCFYALLVSSEGDVSIYDMEKAQASEDEITHS